MPRSLFSFVLFLTFCTVAQAAEDPKIASLKRAGDECAQAAFDRNYSKLADLTYPRAVTFFGGKAAYIRFVKQAMTQIDREGISFVSFKNGEPSKLVKEGKSTFAILPKEVVVKLPDGKYLTKSYMLGISSDDGKTWSFIDGNGLDDERLREKLLPKLPSDLKLPEIPDPEPIEEK